MNTQLNDGDGNIIIEPFIEWNTENRTIAKKMRKLTNSFSKEFIKQR